MKQYRYIEQVFMLYKDVLTVELKEKLTTKGKWEIHRQLKIQQHTSK